MQDNQVDWIILDHPADVMVEVFGSTFEGLCQASVSALNHFLGVVLSVEPVRSERMQIEGATAEEKLVNVLRESLFLFAVDSQLVTKLAISCLKDNIMTVDACLSPAGLGPDSIEIKGVTYHGLKVETTACGYKAKLIFDV